METSTVHDEIDVERGIQILRKLPYRQGQFASRSWGHPFHSLMSYPSKLKPSIAYFLVNLFTRQGERVLDPFSGVGTIPFEACSQGRLGIGSDINPVAYHVAQGKVDPPGLDELKGQILALDRYIHGKSVINQIVEPEIVEYYHPETLREILAARQFFLEERPMNTSFLFACMLHILHGNRPYALSRRSHNIMPWPPKGEFVYKSVIGSLSEKALRTLEASLPMGFVRGISLQEDAVSLSHIDESIDCILTSPPFFGNRDFLRMNRIRLWFAGWDYESQKKMKSKFFEHQKDVSIYARMFREFGRVLRPRHLCVMHLGVVSNYDMAQHIVPLAESAGFAELATLYEDTSKLESHGIVDRGATKKHQFLILRKRD